MDRLKKQVGIARRRLVIQQFLDALAWSWFAALLAAAFAIGVQKWLLVETNGTRWASYWLCGALAGGFIVATAWTWLVRLPELAAAMEIDHRFGLKERVSSALSISPNELETPFGKALVDDATRRIGKLDVHQRFPIQLNRRAYLPLIPAVVAFALCWLADPTSSNQSNASAHTAAIAKQINSAARPIPKKLEQRAQQASDKKLPEAEQLFKKIADSLRELSSKEDATRHEALAKLNDVSKQLEQRREKLADGEQLKQELAAMKNLPAGPADKLAQDMKNGRFDQALKELEKLNDQLAQGKLDPEKQKKLAEQLKAMQEALQKTADAHQKMQAQLEKQIEQAQQAGDQQTTKNLQAQLDQLQAQQPQMNRMTDMASKLQQAAEGMQKGKFDQARSALNKLAENLAEMQKDGEELQMLKSTQDELDETKTAIAGPLGEAESKTVRRNPSGESPGIGHDPGGEGQRPDDLQNVQMYDSKVPQKIGKGSAVVTGLIEGPNAKGQAMEEIKSEVEAAKHESADPLTGQRLPRSQRDHVQQYFDAFRKGQ